MRRVINGFTIIEVMIFLTVSSLLITSAWGLIAGRQEQVMFDQKVRDTQSKLQQWMSDVSNGATNGDLSKQYCVTSVPGGRPTIVNLPQPKPANYSPQCTFLGKAIQFTDNNSSQAGTLYAYSVFGCRIDQCGSGGQTNLPQDMYSANPEPAIGGNGGGYTYADLTETFDLSPAYVNVNSVTGTDQSNLVTTSHMIGFMNSFNTVLNTADNGSEDLNVYLYSLNSNSAPANNGGASVINCLEGQAPCNLTAGSPNPPSLKSYQFCLSDGKYSAQITISSASGIGASTKLDYIAC